MTTFKTKKKTKSFRRTHRPRRHMFALEPRFLFDGAAAATVEQQESAPLPEFQETQQADSESVAAEQLVQSGTAEVSESSLTEAVSLVPEESTSGGELLFIDPRVYQYRQLVDLARPGVEVVILDPLRDGLEQITETLSGRSDVSAIHIVSHGTPGRLFLAAGDLTLETIGSRAGELAALSTSLAEGADLLLYGCDIAAGESGRAFIDALAAATGADVAASSDTTGAWVYGGDWNLEYTVGAIEASIGLTAEVQDQWFAVLDTNTFQEGVNSYAGTQDTQVWGKNTAKDTNYGSTTPLIVSTNEQGGEVEGMIRFDGVFGGGANQIPLGAIIDNVQLVLNVEDGTGDIIRLYRMIVDWNESTATWNSMVGGLDSGVDYSATFDSSVNGPGTGFVTFSGANLVATVQAWSDGTASNYGWAILSDGSNSFQFTSSEGTLANRPELIIDWHLYSISGSISEDVNGDSNLADGVGSGGATVRLFSDGGDGLADGTDDTFVASTLTLGDGSYVFGGLFDTTTYWVVVDSKTLTPDAGVGAADTVWAEQTYGVAGALSPSGTLATAGALYGGRSATNSDNSSDATASLATSDHVTRVDIAGSDVIGIDSAFSFNVVTNVDGDGSDDDEPVNPGTPRLNQGSLHQFILNASTITGDNAMVFVPASNPNVDGGDGLGGGNDYWRITVTSALPQITGDGTTIDGSAYGYTEGVVGITVRDDNTGTLGYSGAVGLGADAVAATGDDPAALTGVQKPELEIVEGAAEEVAVGLDVQANNVAIRDLSIHGFGADNTGSGALKASGDIRVGLNTGGDTGTSLSNILIENNVIGVGPSSLADPGAGNRSLNGILVVGPDDGIIQNNLIASAGQFGVLLTNNADGWTVYRNELRENGREDFGRDGIDIGNLSGGAMVTENYFFANFGSGVDSWRGDGGNLIENNTFDGNGQGGSETSAVRELTAFLCQVH